jgi:hypothetical protein
VPAIARRAVTMVPAIVVLAALNLVLLVSLLT